MDLHHFESTPPNRMEQEKLPFSDLQASQSQIGDIALSHHVSRTSLQAPYNSEPDHSPAFRSGPNSNRSAREMYHSLQSLALRSEEAHAT